VGSFANNARADGHYFHYAKNHDKEDISFGRMGLRPTGLSACIFFACGKKGYRSYPLRVASLG
jgi:hypothetical protein